MKDTKKLGLIIKELRLKNDLSLRDLAERSGMSYSFINSIENNRYSPSRDTVLALADSLRGANKNELLLLAGFSPEADPKPSSDPYYTLTEKDDRDIAKDLEKMLSDLEGDEALAFHGEPMTEEDRDLLRISLENSMRLAKEMAKKKFTPKKYRD